MVEVNYMIHLEKFDKEKPLSVVYFDGEKSLYYVKRFIPEDSDKKELFISEADGSFLEIVSTSRQPKIEIVFKKIKGKQKEEETVDLEDFIAVKGMKAQGNQLTKDAVKQINLIETAEEEKVQEEIIEEEVNTEEVIEDIKPESDDPQITLEL